MENNEKIFFNPPGTILEEKGSNWEALENLNGKKLLHRCYSCEFHFKQSVNKILKDSMSKYGSHAKFQSLCKQMLESSNKANFERFTQKLEDFLDEQPDHEKLKDWLKQWVFLKQHIFYGFKGALLRHSNLTEVIKLSWVSTNTTYLLIYEYNSDDAAEFITIKQMLKRYEEGKFSSGSGI